MTDPNPTDESLTASQLVVEREREAMRALNAQMPDSLWDWEIGPQREWYSSRFISLLSEALSAPGLSNALLAELANLAHSDNHAAADAIRAHLSDGRAFDVELRLPAANGAYHWYQLRGTGLLAPDGALRLSAGVIADIQHHKTIEAQNIAYQTALELKNEVLDEFAHAASHDLRAPLHSIAQLAAWIDEDCGDELNDSSRRHLVLLKDRAQRMILLINGMLEYASSEAGDGQLETIDVGQLLRSIESLVIPPGGPAVQLTLHCTSVLGRRVPLQQCLHNLIDNAIKHSNAENPVVTVTVTRVGEAVEFAVTDNGPGIAPEYQQRIFGMFETLRPKDQVEGSGIGLAIVRKITKTYGAQVRLESAPEQGSTFTLVWPEKT